MTYIGAGDSGTCADETGDSWTTDHSNTGQEVTGTETAVEGSKGTNLLYLYESVWLTDSDGEETAAGLEEVEENSTDDCREQAGREEEDLADSQVQRAQSWGPASPQEPRKAAGEQRKQLDMSKLVEEQIQ